MSSRTTVVHALLIQKPQTNSPIITWCLHNKAKMTSLMIPSSELQKHSQMHVSELFCTIHSEEFSKEIALTCVLVLKLYMGTQPRNLLNPDPNHRPSSVNIASLDNFDLWVALGRHCLLAGWSTGVTGFNPLSLLDRQCWLSHSDDVLTEILSALSAN